MDVAKYETHRSSAEQLVTIAKKYGNDEMAQVNEQNVKRYDIILRKIRDGGVIVGTDLLSAELADDIIDNEGCIVLDEETVIECNTSIAKTGKYVQYRLF